VELIVPSPSLYQLIELGERVTAMKRKGRVRHRLPRAMTMEEVVKFLLKCLLVLAVPRFIETLQDLESYKPLEFLPVSGLDPRHVPTKQQ
jgi:hypothetical protein